MKKAGIIAIIVISIPIVFISCNAARWFGGAVEVAQQEFGAKELLRKYEWFKDAAASLDKKRADIQVYQSRITQMNEDYSDTHRKDWPRTDREQMSVWQAESSGVKASYNGLAAEYNSQMAKFNWRFCNAGTLPKGATVTLPREFASYIDR